MEKEPLILKDDIMDGTGKHIWIPAGSKFIYFPEKDNFPAHYACGTYIIEESNVVREMFV